MYACNNGIQLLQWRIVMDGHEKEDLKTQPSAWCASSLLLNILDVSFSIWAFLFGRKRSTRKWWRDVNQSLNLQHLWLAKHVTVAGNINLNIYICSKEFLEPQRILVELAHASESSTNQIESTFLLYWKIDFLAYFNAIFFYSKLLILHDC